MPGGGSRHKDAIVKDEDIVFREEVEWNDDYLCVCLCVWGGGHPSRRFQHWVPSVESSAHTSILAGTRMGRNAVWKTVFFFFSFFLASHCSALPKKAEMWLSF